jgi:hypothetical protein
MKILTPEFVRSLGGNVKITSSALTRNLEFQLALMEKQIKKGCGTCQVPSIRRPARRDEYARKTAKH